MTKQTAFARNIKALREDSGITQAELQKQLQLGAMTVSTWERSGVTRPHPKTVEQLCEYFGVSSGDLLSENGYYAKTRGMSTIAPRPATGSLPIVGAAHAGDPSPAYELYGGTLDCPEEYCREGNFFIRINGDSMDRQLVDGTYALIDVHAQVKSGDIALVKVNGDDATVKRVKFMDGIAVLEPDSSNPSHRRRMIDSSDPESPEVRILGKVVYAVTRF
jgi:repressor LexA